MAITYEAHGHTSIQPASSSWSFTPDAGTLAGDAFLVSVFTQDAHSNITPPSGSFGLFNNQLPGGNADSDNRSSAFVWIAPSNTPGPVSVGVSTVAQGTVSWLRFRGVSPTAPVDHDRWVTANGGGSPDTQVMDVTTLGPDRMIVGGWAGDAGASVDYVTAPSGWTTYNGDILPRKGALAVKGIQASAGTSGHMPPWATYPDNAWSGSRLLFMAALAPASSTPDPDPDPGPDPDPTGNASVVHAVVGAWRPDGFTVTAKTTGATSARLKVGSNTSVTSSVAYSSYSTVDPQGYVSLTIAGLPARAQDHYLIEMLDSNGQVSSSGLLGSPSRIPGSGAPWSGRIAWGSCYHSHQPAISSLPIDGAFGRIHAKNPDLFFHVGDWDYWDNDSTSVADHRWDMEEPLRLSSALRSLVADTPTFYIKSDHDGDAGERGVGPWTAPNRQATLQMFPYPQRPDPNGLYHATTIGRVRFIFSDTRYLGTVDSTRLGPVQLAWLKAEFERPEPLKIWVQDSIWITDEPNEPGEDDWANHSEERAEIGQHWIDHGVGTLLGLYGDQHALSADDGSGNDWGGFPTFCAAPFRNTSSQKTLSQGKWSNGFWPAQTGTPSAQYGILDLTDDGSMITASMRGYDTSDVVRVSMTVTATDGSPAASQPSGVGLTSPSKRWIKGSMRSVWHDGSGWRAIVPTPEGHRLDSLSRYGTLAGRVIDSRQSARCSVARHGNSTYVLVAHATAPTFHVLNSSYATVAQSTPPLLAADHDRTPTTVHVSPNGSIWIAAMNGSGVQVARSTNGTSWESATVVSTSMTGVVAFGQSGDTVVLIATANEGVGSWVRTLGQAQPLHPGGWGVESLPQLNIPLTSDDHLSVVSHPDGRIFVATKTTGAPSNGYPLLYSVRRNPNGSWGESRTIEGGPDNAGYTRPVLTLAGALLVAFYGSYQAPGFLSYRTLDLSNPAASWSSRSTVLSSEGWNDSAAAPSSIPSEQEWPFIAHNTETGEIRTSWTSLWGTVENPMYKGTRKVVEVRYAPR